LRLSERALNRQITKQIIGLFNITRRIALVWGYLGRHGLPLAGVAVWRQASPHRRRAARDDRYFTFHDFREIRKLKFEKWLPHAMVLTTVSRAGGFLSLRGN